MFLARVAIFGVRYGSERIFSDAYMCVGDVKPETLDIVQAFIDVHAGLGNAFDHVQGFESGPGTIFRGQIRTSVISGEAEDPPLCSEYVNLRLAIRPTFRPANV